MKNLRQLARLSGLLNSGKRRRRTEKPRGRNTNARILNSETLEKRELLAGDMITLSPQHNYWNSYDVNDDGQISARDALAIINKLGQVSAEGEAATMDGPDESGMFYDVNADFEVTASDALSVINAFSRGEEVGELIELQIRALSDPDDINSEITEIGVGETFHLEVSYDDLRTNTLFERNELGAFQLFTDIAVSRTGVLVPVLNETQRLIIGEEAGSVPFDSITFSIEDSATTYVATATDFINNSIGEINSALAAFGYATDETSVESVQFEGNNNLGFQIQFLGSQFGNMDLPNISVDVNETDPNGPEVFTDFDEFAPFLSDGTTPNPAAIPFNLNTFSRTFNNNEEFYRLFPRGSYDLNGSEAFTGVGGLGDVPTGGGGIPNLTDDGSFDQPFDVFSIPVQLRSAVTDLMISVNPGEDPEATLLYGRDDAVPQDLVLLDEDAVITISTTGMAVPEIDDFALTPTEDMTATIDLNTRVNNGTADSFMVSTNAANGTAVIDQNGVLTYTPNADFDGTETFVVTATFGTQSDTATGSVTVTAVNDAPVAVADSATTPQDTALTLTAASLLANDTDVDNVAADLSITAVSTTTTNATVVLDGTNITYTPPTGFTGTDSFSYTLSDSDLTSTGTVSVTVGEVMVVAPMADDTTRTVNEDDSFTIDLSTITTGDGVTFTAGNGAVGSVSISGNILTYTPNADVFGSDSVTYTATNSAGSDAGTIAISITAVNDVPTAGDDTATATTGQTITISAASLLGNDDVGADNESSDVLTIVSVGSTTANGSSVSLSNNGTTVSYTAGSAAGSDSFTYTIDDGSGATNSRATATVNVTVTAAALAPVADNGVINTSQNSPGTFDLAILLSGGDADTLAITTNGSIGNATISGTTLTYTPDANASGTDTIVYTATNSVGSDTGTISVSIGAVNVTVDATEDTTATFTSSQLVADQLLSIINPRDASAGGSVALNASGGVTYTPAANFFGEETFVITVVNIGSPIPENVTVTVNVAGVNDAPVAFNDNVTVFTGSETNINVLGNDNAGPANEDQSLTVTAASSDSGAVTINSDGTLAFTPNAGALGPATINYTVEDSDGASDSAVVNVTIDDVQLSNVSGVIFIDNIESIDNPVRDGIKNGSDAGIGGIQVRLVSSTGATVAAVRTRLDGGYTFNDVEPGNYTVVYDVPDSVRTIGSTSAALVVNPESGSPPTGPDLTLAGTQGAAASTLTILSSSYLRANRAMATATNGGREGGLVTFDESGVQEIFIAGEGFEDVVYGELLLNSARNTALMVIIREGATAAEVATLGSDNFVVSNDGLGVQFYGGLEDFDFTSTDSADGPTDFAGYLAAVDRVLGEL